MHIYALINNNDSAIAFMDICFAALYRFPLIKLRRPLVLNIIDGRTISSGYITHYTEVPMQI